MNGYEDIINLSHYEFKNHKRMAIENRSAQFAPFSALCGYSEEIIETARLTERRLIITEDRKDILNNKLNIVENNINNKCEIEVNYFLKDNKKLGGSYLEHKGIVKKIDKIKKLLIFEDGNKIKLEDIFDIKSDIIKI